MAIFARDASRADILPTLAFTRHLSLCQLNPLMISTLEVTTTSSQLLRHGYNLSQHYWLFQSQVQSIPRATSSSITLSVIATKKSNTEGGNVNSKVPLATSPSTRIRIPRASDNSLHLGSHFDLRYPNLIPNKTSADCSP